MDSININGQDVPVLNSEATDELPLVSYKSHHGYVASGEECVDELSLDGSSFWCPIEFLRISEGDENIRKTPFTEDETDRYTKTIAKTGDIGTLIVCADGTGKAKLRILDGNNRFPILVNGCNPSHVFVKYVEVSTEYEARQIQDTANEHSDTTHKTEAFAALANKRDIDAMPKGDRQAQFDYQYAKMRCKSKARGKTEFDKLWKRARYAIPEVWAAFEKGQITIESLDWIATLVDINTDKVLVALQQEVLNIAVKGQYKTSQVENEVKTAYGNWERALASQQTPEPVEDDDIEGEVELVSSKGATRPAPATAPKTASPPTLQPPVEAPVEKLTHVAIAKQKQQAKVTKGQGGKRSTTTTAAKTTATKTVVTNAPAAITAPAKIEATIVPVDVYQSLLDIEAILVDRNVVLSNASDVTESVWAKFDSESLTLKETQNILAQIKVMRQFLQVIENAADSAQQSVKARQ